MKKIIALLSILVLVGCEGNTGPRGPQGPKGDPGTPGQSGSGLVGQGFEVETNFNADNDYAQLFQFTDYNAEALDSDIVLVYLKYEVDQETGNDVWQQLPASYFLSDGSEVQYGFDHTLNDVSIFLGGNADFSTLDPIYTQDQTFRVAILPVEYVQNNNIDVENMDEVMRAISSNRNLKHIKLSD